MKTYRVAILGCRARGTSIAWGYHAHPRTEVVALCDLRQNLLDELGDALGVSARFTDLDEMIPAVEPDLVAIPTGTEFHYDLAMRVMEYGVNIDVEKPMCVDLQQADDLLAKAKEKGVKIAVHHQGRVDSGIRAIWQAYQEGRIGELRYILGSGKGYYGGYGLMNIGTHMLTNIIKFGGRCRSVSALGLTGGHPVTLEDVIPCAGGMGTVAGEHITATLQFDGNLSANLLQHRMPRVDSLGYNLELYGTEGRIIWREPSLLPTPHFRPDGEHDRWEALKQVAPEGFDPDCGAAEGEFWFAEEYARALDENRDHECSGQEAHHVMEIMMAIFESMAYRRAVELPQERRDHPLLRWREENGLGEPAPLPRGYGEWLRAEDQRLGREV